MIPEVLTGHLKDEHNTTTLSEAKKSNVVTLEWENIQIFAPGNKTILEKQSGSVTSGSFLGVFGTPGSGKSSLLRYLSGFLEPEYSTEGQFRISGVEGITQYDLRLLCGFSDATDCLESSLTPFEIMHYNAKFNLNFLERGEIYGQVHKTVEMMKIENIKNMTIRSLKGKIERTRAQLRKAAIAAELVKDPRIVIVDDAATDLSSEETEVVLNAFRELADENKVVICSFTSPTPAALKTVDNILLLHKGTKVFYGTAADFNDFLETQDVEVPPYINPLRFFINVLSLGNLGFDSFSDDSDLELKTVEEPILELYSPSVVKRIEFLGEYKRNFVTIFSSSENTTLVKELLEEAKAGRMGFLRSIFTLFCKHSLIILRDWRELLTRLFSFIVITLFAVPLFWDLTFDQRGIQNRKGVMYFVSMACMICSIQTSCLMFSRGSRGLRKDLKEEKYSALAFYIAKSIAQLIPTLTLVVVFANILFFTSKMNNKPLKLLRYNTIVVLGSLAADSAGLLLSILNLDEITRSLTSATTVICILSLTSGFFIDLDSMPLVLWPMQYISFFKYMFEGLILNEFGGLNGCKDGICLVPRQEMGFRDTTFRCMIVLLGVFAGVRVFAYLTFLGRFRGITYYIKSSNMM